MFTEIKKQSVQSFWADNSEMLEELIEGWLKDNPNIWVEGVTRVYNIRMVGAILLCEGEK